MSEQQGNLNLEPLIRACLAKKVWKSAFLSYVANRWDEVAAQVQAESFPLSEKAKQEIGDILAHTKEESNADQG